MFGVYVINGRNIAYKIVKLIRKNKFCESEIKLEIDEQSISLKFLLLKYFKSINIFRFSFITKGCK